jgi:hypothetical protein
MVLPEETSVENSSYAGTINVSSISSSSSSSTKLNESRDESKAETADFSSISIYSPDHLVIGPSANFSASMMSIGPHRESSRDDYTTWMSPLPALPPWMRIMDAEENSRLSLSAMEESKDSPTTLGAGVLPSVQDNGVQEYSGPTTFLLVDEAFPEELDNIVEEKQRSLVEEARGDRSIKRPRRS